jgi:hypothetical protein
VQVLGRVGQSLSRAAFNGRFKRLHLNRDAVEAGNDTVTAFLCFARKRLRLRAQRLISSVFL